MINEVKIRLNIIVTCLRALNCGFYYTRAALPFMKKGNACIHKYYTLRFYFPYLSLLAQPVNILVYYTLHVYFPICPCQRSQSLFSYMDRSLFQYMDRPGTYIIILDIKYNIANSSCQFGSYGSIWTGPSPKKYYMDLRRFGPYKKILLTDQSIYCHMTLSAMNYLLYTDRSIFQYIDRARSI